MQNPKLNHKNYNKFSTVRQLVLPLDYSPMIPETEPVRLQMNCTLVKIRPLRYRVMKQYKFLVV